jgi:uncharacterized repeat protein (TIGR03833 family)
LTKGTVETILTNSSEYPHGKVRLKEHDVGRVKEVLVAGTKPIESKKT